MKIIMESILNSTIFLLIGFAIMAIGANTGGNKGLKHSWDKLKKKDGDNVTLKDVLGKLFVAAFGGFGVSYVYFAKEDKDDTVILLFILEISFIVSFIQTAKKYKSKPEK